MINLRSRILVTGHKGLVGSSIVRTLKSQGYKNIITIDHKLLDLRDYNKVEKFFSNKKIDAVINAAAKVGGIYANNLYKADFIYDNLAIQNNVIHNSFKNGVKDLIFLGSSCIYPRNSAQPIKETELLSGPLEITNEPYAIAKIAGIKMCESYNFQYNTNYKCLMPCNIYGPNDNYDPFSSHFFPALISKVHSANKMKKKHISIWGTGTPKRELMYVDDLAAACIFFLKKKTKETLLNVGTGKEMSILQYAKFIINEINPNIKVKFIKPHLDGVPRKIINSNKAKKYGWRPTTSLKKGFIQTYVSFQKRK